MSSRDAIRWEYSVVLDGHGRLNRISVVPAPLPQPIQDDHVEVQVYYCGLNFTDNYLRLGIIRNDARVFMGSECCGVVTRVGDNVNDLEAGQRVVCLRMQGGLFRRVVQVPRANVFPLPPTIGLKDAMALALDALVAYVCLFELGQVRKAAVVFMQSLGGGVGTMVAQLARTVPLVTVLGTASEDKHDGLWRLGVNRVYRHEDNFVERILRLYPEGADIVIVRSGGAETEKCLKLLKPCGRLVTIGSDNTATYPRTKTMALQRPKWDTRYLSSAELINKNVMVSGLNIGDLIENHPYDVDTALDNMFDLHLQKKIKPQIHSILPFEKMADGLELLCRRQNFGKVLLEVRDESELTSPLGQQVPGPSTSTTTSNSATESVSVSWQKHQRRVVCRKIKDWVRQVEASRHLQDEEAPEEEADGDQSDPDSLDGSMFTEVEADTAAEMTRAIDESEAEA